MVVDEKLLAVQEMERKQKEEEDALEQLTMDAGTVWDEVQNAVSLQGQCNHRIQQLLDLAQEGRKLLKPSEELLKCVHVETMPSDLSSANLVCRARNCVDSKKRDVKQQTEEMLAGQNKLGLLRRTVRDLQAQLLEVQESKKVAVTGIINWFCVVFIRILML